MIKSSGIKNEIIFNKALAEELHKWTIRNLKKRKVHSNFIDNIWGNNLADLYLINKFYKGFRFALYVTDFISNVFGLFLQKIKRNFVYLRFSKNFKRI